MDKFVKYPLPIDRSTVNWKMGYMEDGGNQLVEIMEKEFPLEWIKENQKRLKINDINIKKIELWIEENLVVGTLIRLLNLPGSASAKSFFYNGGGVLRKLMREIDITPIWDGEQFISKYSFIEYDVIGNEEGTLIVPKFSKTKWVSKGPEKIDLEIISKQFYFECKDNQWRQVDPTSELAEDLKTGYEVMKRLTT